MAQMPTEHTQEIADALDFSHTLPDILFYLAEQSDLSAQELDMLMDTWEELHIKIRDLYKSALKDYRATYWRGFAVALKVSGRQDLLADYPEAEKATVQLEAELQLRRHKRRPPEPPK